MQLTIYVPDDFVDPVKDTLARQPTGVLEAVALDAILGFLNELGKSSSPGQRA
jgi:hypothetical protein